MSGMKRRLLSTGVCCLSLAGFGLLGCGPQSDVAPVSGVVTLDGEPVVGAYVSFTPTQGGRPSHGRTGDDGAYELTYVEEGDGAKIGPHDVTVTLIAEGPAAGNSALGSLAEGAQRRASPTWIVPERYSKRSTSGLDYEVAPGRNRDADFALTSD